MYAGRVSSLMLPSGELRRAWRRGRQTDRRTPGRYITHSVKFGRRNNVRSVTPFSNYQSVDLFREITWGSLAYLKSIHKCRLLCIIGHSLPVQSTLILQIMFCQGWELNLVNVVSAILVQRPGTVFRLICTTSLTLKHFKNGSRVCFLILSLLICDFLRRSWTFLGAAPAHNKSYIVLYEKVGK